MNDDPVAALTEIQSYILRYRDMAASGKYDTEKSRMIRSFAAAMEIRTRELDRENKL
jgi:hypothetical protein